MSSASAQGQPKARTASRRNWEIQDPPSANMLIPQEPATRSLPEHGGAAHLPCRCKRSCLKRNTHFKTNRVNI